MFPALTSVGTRIREVRASVGLTQEAFTDRLNAVLRKSGRPTITRAAVSNWERDQGIKNENQVLIADVFDVSFDWLGTGRGRMRDGRHHERLEASRRAETRQLRPGDIVERDARGGLRPRGSAPPVVVDGKMVDDVRAVWTFPPDFIHAELRAREPDLDILPVYGDSMIPTLLPGERVSVHRCETYPSPDGVFAIADGVGTASKRLQPVRGSDLLQVRIISDNPLHKEDIILASDLVVLGRVICKLQRL